MSLVLLHIHSRRHYLEFYLKEQKKYQMLSELHLQLQIQTGNVMVLQISPVFLKVIHYQSVLNSHPAICIQRAKYLTKYLKGKRSKNEARVITRARAVSYVLENLDLNIYDELIVGGITSKRVGAILFPEFSHLSIWPELKTIRERKVNP